MSRTSNRRLSRVEKLAAPVIAERKRREAEEAAWQCQAARDHATKLVTLILHGEKDEDVPVSQGYEFFRALKDHGVETEMVVYPREPHGIGETTHVQDLITRVCDWFERHLMK